MAERPSEVCRHCGEPVERAGSATPWFHRVGLDSVLYRCDPIKSGKPYGLNAEPGAKES